MSGSQQFVAKRLKVPVNLDWIGAFKVSWLALTKRRILFELVDIPIDLHLIDEPPPSTEGGEDG